jgi:RNA-directed DNA polymerase
MFQTYPRYESLFIDHVVSEHDLASQWNSIDWTIVRESVFRIQCRIARAADEHRLPDIALLQDELVHSHEAKLLVVHEITGKKSRAIPGIDGIVWKTPAEKMFATIHLNEPGYKPVPVKRFYIPKESSYTLRPVGIPTMNDRAVQALYASALQPVAETWGDPDSFGYRLYRSAKDACSVIRNYLDHAGKPVWVLDADITSCFDRISHEWLIRNIPLCTKYLSRMLRSGFVYRGNYFPVNQGVPQGGIISPLLANMTLDGLEPQLAEKFSGRPDEPAIALSAQSPEIRFVRYADDFILLAQSRTVIEEAWDEVEAFLQPRGLSLSAEKTRIASLDEGFDFLHWHFRKRGASVSVTVSDASLRHIRQTLTEIFLSGALTSPEDIVRMLNPLLRGYAYYHRDADAHHVFRSLDAYIQQEVRRLLGTWYPDKSAAWLAGTFWQPTGQGSWQFYPEGTQGLYLLSLTPSHPHPPLQTDHNPYLDREYFLKRHHADDALDRAVSRDRVKQMKNRQRWMVGEYP